ncbi:lsm14b-b [Symbiodinium sp. CCMP2456]|nr:lsm14b-b [Symbiodinium sp. CCMP2456]
MSSGVPYIGSKISLITTSDMRYEGFLRTLNREESTIAVESVRSFGTEGRADQTRGQSEIPVSNEIYDFIVFRGKDLKDLTVLQGIPENAPQPQPAPATRPPAQSPPHMQGSYGQHLNKKSIEYDTGPGMYHPSQMAPSGPMGEGPSGGFGSSGYQRHSPPAVSRNGYGPPPSSCGGAGVGHMGDSLGGSYLSTGSRPPSEKSGYGQVRIEAPSRTPPSYHDGPHGPPPSYVERPAPSQYEDLPAGPPRGGPGCGHRMGDEGKGGPAAPRPPGAMTSHVQEGKDRNGHVAYGMPGAVEGKGASAGFNPSVEAKGRGRGKGGQKQTLSEVLKTHKKAEEAIVKLMRSQGSAAVSPQELRAMSEQQSCIYHFHLDYLNFCGPASGGAVFSQQSDEQNWDSLREPQTEQSWWYCVSLCIVYRSGTWTSPSESRAVIAYLLFKLAEHVDAAAFGISSICGSFAGSQGQSAEKTLREGFWIWPGPLSKQDLQLRFLRSRHNRLLNRSRKSKCDASKSFSTYQPL